MGPASSVYFGSFAGMSKAGPAYAFSIVLAVIGCLLIAHSVAEFSRKLPSAGMAYTFATATFGPRAGFMTGWVLLVGYVPILALLSAAVGILSEQFFDTYFDLNVPWWVFTTVSIIAVILVCNSGVSRSAKVTLGFLVLEGTIFTALFLTIIFKGGADGNTFAPFNPANSLNGTSGIAYGVLWAFWMFFGFEAAGTLGEETKQPRRNVPRALFTAVLIIGSFYLLSAYAAAIGFGVHSGAYAKDSSPWDTLSRTYWGQGVSWIVLLTVINGTFAIMMSAYSATVRVLYAMGRERILPSVLGVADETTGVPKRAGTYYGLAMLAVVLIAGLSWGPSEFWLFAGVLNALGLITAYIVICLSLPFFYKRKHPAEFSVVRHGVLPVAGALVALLPLWGGVWPVPDFPMNLVPYVFLAFMLGGAVYLAYAVRKRPEVLQGMGRVFIGDDDAAQAIEPGSVPNPR
jgi:amino acid transporter